MREKLIEIVFSSLCKHIHKSCNLAENITDDLIANGVTISKMETVATDNNVGDKVSPTGWIPVTERLPETKTEVLVYTGTSIFSHTFFATESIIQSGITHWMPIPTPPKGE